MLKRTMGRLLLTLLVITGLAGTIGNNAISKQERKSAINVLKDSRNELLKTVKDLSKAQLKYRPAPGSPSIRESIYHLVNAEKNLWQLLEQALQSPANPEKRRSIRLSDEDLVALMEDRTRPEPASGPFATKTNHYRTVAESIEGLKKMRAEHIRYMRSTTEDLRNHVVELSFGKIDCYQLCLLMAAHMNRHRLEIEELKSHPGYPK